MNLLPVCATPAEVFSELNEPSSPGCCRSPCLTGSAGEAPNCTVGADEC